MYLYGIKALMYVPVQIRQLKHEKKNTTLNGYVRALIVNCNGAAFHDDLLHTDNQSLTAMEHLIGFNRERDFSSFRN